MSATNHTAANPSFLEEGIAVTPPLTEEQADILSSAALRFVASLARRFRTTRDELLKLRVIRQREIDAGLYPGFLAETEPVRRADWIVAPDGNDVDYPIAGPVDRATMLASLNSSAGAYVADFDDATSPTWSNCVEGQINLRDAVRGTIDWSTPAGTVRLEARSARPSVRPRGWHLDERHMRVDGQAVPAALFDFGLFFFHNARALVDEGATVHFHLPKLESHLEARLWNDVFQSAEDALGVPGSAVRAAVRIESVLAAFEMDEILFELRDHAAGLDWSRWGYAFNLIKRFRKHRDFVLPDRARINADQRFLRSVVDLVETTRLRRGVGAHSAPANAGPASYGHVVTAQDLLSLPRGDVTERALRSSIRVGILCLEAWLGGRGSVVIDGMVENAAAAELSRAQVWQWIRHRVDLGDGHAVTREQARGTIEEELAVVARMVGGKAFRAGRFDLATKLFTGIVTDEDFPEFIPELAYAYLD